MSHTTLSAYLDQYYIILCPKFSICVDTKCSPSSEDLKCSDASCYTPHYMAIVTLLFPVQSVFILTVRFSSVLFWTEILKKNTFSTYFHSFFWAKEMVKHVTLHYPLFEVVHYSKQSNPRPFLQYGEEG